LGETPHHRVGHGPPDLANGVVLPASGGTRLVRRMTKRLRSGSIHIDVPVNPVWPKERGPKSDPAEEFSLGVSHPSARLESGTPWRS
jgi:hypothetical protein